MWSYVIQNTKKTLKSLRSNIGPIYVQIYVVMTLPWSSPQGLCDN